MILPEKITIIGVGLLGASLGQGLLRRGLVREVVGYGRSRTNLEVALERGCITEIAEDLAIAVRDVSLVVVCTPVGKIVELVHQCVAAGSCGTVFTDVGSTKGEIVSALRVLPGENVFVGGHPIAGREATGAVAADGDLFVGTPTVLTPLNTTPQDALAAVQALWESVGAQVVCLSAEEHDAILAKTSHIPHLLSCVLSAVTPPSLDYLSGTGFASMTRLARGSGELWRDILMQNRQNVLSALELLTGKLQELHQTLSNGDVAELEAFLNLAKKNRDALGN